MSDLRSFTPPCADAAAVPQEAAPPSAPRSRGRPRKSPEEKDDGNRRAEVVRSAARLFRHQGYAATSTRDIADAAGMRSGSPFYHFKSKGELLTAVMEEGMRRAFARQTEALLTLPPNTADPVAQLRVLVRNHFDVLLGPDSDFIPVMLYEWRSLDEGQRIVIKQLKDVYEAVWNPVLLALQARGQLRGDVRVARLLIFGALNWAVQWYDPERSLSLDALTDAALQLFLKDE